MKPGTCRMHILAAVAAGIFLSGFTGLAVAASPEEKRKEIRKMRSETLTKLYKVHPLAKGGNKAPRSKLRGINGALQAAGFRQPSPQGAGN